MSTAVSRRTNCFQYLSTAKCSRGYEIYLEISCGKISVDSRRFYLKLHPGYEWHTFHILTSEDSADVIPLFFLCFSSIFYLFSKHSYLCYKKKFTRWLEHNMKFNYLLVKKNFNKIFFPLEEKLHMIMPPSEDLFYL